MAHCAVSGKKHLLHSAGYIINESSGTARQHFDAPTLLPQRPSEPNSSTSNTRPAIELSLRRQEICEIEELLEKRIIPLFKQVLASTPGINE